MTKLCKFAMLKARKVASLAGCTRVDFGWTAHSEAFVRDNWGLMSTKAIVEALDTSYKQVRAKAEELGLPGRTYSTQRLLELARECCKRHVGRTA